MYLYNTQDNNNTKIYILLSEDFKYVLQFNDGYELHIWDVQILSEPKYVPAKYQYKFLNIGGIIDYETNVLQITLISKNELKKSILKRIVLIEKIENKIFSNLYDDPILEWSFQQLFSSIVFANRRNFKLLKLDKFGHIITIWGLSECALFNSTIWRSEKNNAIIKTSFNQTIWIKPNSILQL